MTRTKVCAKHIDKPAIIYGHCVGCELENLREERNRYRQELSEMKREVKELQDGISQHIQFLDKHHKGWEDVWNNEQLERDKLAANLLAIRDMFK